MSRRLGGGEGGITHLARRLAEQYGDSTAVPRDAEVRDYKLEIVSASGALLSTLAADLGKWDAVSWISVGGGFEPFCPAPIACTRYTPRGADSNPPGNDYFRITGDPRTAPGASSGTTYAATSQGCATMDVTNDSSTPITKTSRCSPEAMAWLAMASA